MEVYRVLFLTVPTLHQHLSSEEASPAFAGLAITYVLNFAWITNDLILNFASAEKMMVGVERVLEYANETPLEEEEDDGHEEIVDVSSLMIGMV